MTSEQELAFNTFGCGCRCLIKLSELQGKPTTNAAFLAKFLPNYGKLWGEQIGGTITSTLIDIARDMGLCTYADTRTDLKKVREIINKGCAGVIVTTDREIDANGVKHQLFHCRLFRGFDRVNGNWALWEPYQNGDEGDSVCYSDKDIEERLAHFLIFYRIDQTPQS
jgi:hypothetical protein